jgi:hypothetical protein
VTDPRFLVVGTARSGTTLVQRLASELDGVRVPTETHFLRFLPSIIDEPGFPLGGADLVAVLERYRVFAAVMLDGIAFDVDAVVESLDGTCERPLDLFGAIVRHLASGAPLTGEKSPGHLLWWRPLARARPDLRFVGVVRDPRAVVASHRALWGGATELISLRWKADTAVLEDAAPALGPRLLLLRYEDVVTAPDGAKERLAAFLETTVPAAVAAPGGAAPLFGAGETWKDRALRPVDATRADAWREALTPRDVGVVEAVCRRGMRAHGYAPVPSVGRALARQALLPPVSQWRRAKRWYLRSTERRQIAALGERL